MKTEPLRRQRKPRAKNEKDMPSLVRNAGDQSWTRHPPRGLRRTLYRPRYERQEKNIRSYRVGTAEIAADTFGTYKSLTTSW